MTRPPHSKSALMGKEGNAMGKKVVVTDANGKTTETSVNDDATAREFENLPFEADHITSVTVTDE